MKIVIVLLSALAICSKGEHLRRLQNSAEHPEGLRCGFFDGDKNFVISDDVHAVETNSQGKYNISIYKCWFKDVAPPPNGGTLNEKGFHCKTPTGNTYDSHKVVTPSGNMMVECKVKVPNP